MELAKGFLKSIFEREGEEAASLSRREALAGLGLVGVLLAAPKLLGFNARRGEAARQGCQRLWFRRPRLPKRTR